MAEASSVLENLKAAYRMFPAADWGELSLIALLVGLIGFSAFSTITLLCLRKSARRYKSFAQHELDRLHTEIYRLEALLFSEPQVLICWMECDKPDIRGDLSIIALEDRPEEVLLFSSWLEPQAVRPMEEAVGNLRDQGKSFEMEVVTATGRLIGAEGRAIGGSAILRLYEIRGLKRTLSNTIANHHQLKSQLEALQRLIDISPAPMWARDANDSLVFANTAYVRAVDASDAEDAITRNVELFDRNARNTIIEARKRGRSFSGRLPAIAAGERRVFDVIDSPSTSGTIGTAIDRTETDNIRSELARIIDAHRRVLDQLSTGVAVFNGERKLIFYNAAFQTLFDLAQEFLEQTPSDNALLELLRGSGKLPEQQDFRQWKQELHEAYRAVEPQEHMWHLPDGRTLRIVTTPNSEGGVTYLYDDVTEKLDMHRRYDALIKVQRETLDHLTEAVTVFGSDGRVRLHNPAFQRMWKLSAEALNQRPHVDAVAGWCHALHDDSRVWRSLCRTVTAIDFREPMAARLERRDGILIDLATTPLPDGATLVTFQDVTDTINVERALRERNEALEAADSIKIKFVHHVSYELRSPLTNIIGFANLLEDRLFGSLTVKQREYVGYITASTNALLAIINNILDLASIDAGAVKLNLTNVDIRASMEAAAEGVRDRLVKNDITLAIRTSPAIGSFMADERRLRQVLFNLLSNAVGFSPRGESVTLTAERVPGAIVFTVTDHGPGIPLEAKDKVFDWFETDPQGSEHRGPGLGLSLVRSFVELHGGNVSIDSSPGQGATITCTFPVAREKSQNAA